MKKRLRKKKHLGEFKQFGLQLLVLRNRKDGFNEFLDTFIEKAVEESGCFCGGGGPEDILDVIIELGKNPSDHSRKLDGIVAWLKSRPDVKEWKFGPLFDLWYEDAQEIGIGIEQPCVGDGEDHAAPNT
jgi:uncharacterized protein YggL (DUF469 family)